MTAYVRDICPRCGNLRSVCSDPERPVYPQRTMCYLTAVRDLTMRRVAARYAQEPGTRELHPTDGMSLWASPDDLTPESNWL